jgi:hypothetical protein
MKVFKLINYCIEKYSLEAQTECLSITYHSLHGGS